MAHVMARRTQGPRSPHKKKKQQSRQSRLGCPRPPRSGLQCSGTLLSVTSIAIYNHPRVYRANREHLKVLSKIVFYLLHDGCIPQTGFLEDGVTKFRNTTFVTGEGIGQQLLHG